MGIQYGTSYSSTDDSKLAPGTKVDAGVRRFHNDFSLATQGGGTQDTPLVARIREGCAVCAFELSSSVDLSGLTFKLGIATDDDKYAVAFAGPAAGKTVRAPIVPAMLAAGALEQREDIILTPSANMPAAGVVCTELFASKR
ncbi:hypothetical protein [Stakelama pacifica]|uniref:Uncharacterized protein n=1 Tax=Stakelama pacifica TaxID=517720 RepID=A0A4R6FMZ8_9SPHN|nr:hypothetical protein [Stakelama pacifica]TDN82976.1 hypothetical protein EV664_105174 [Stakelama pacifica]GGO95027.1 hypothetical protein GCM10011329_18240 [Stakelama pacifica]